MATLATLEADVIAARPGSTAEASALRLWAIRALRVNPARYTVPELRALFEGRGAGAPATTTPAPEGNGGGLTEADVEAIARRVMEPRERVITVQPDGTRRALPDGEHAHHELKNVLAWCASGSSVYLHGPAGTGKTTLARQVAALLGRTFYADGSIYKEAKLLGSTLGSKYFATPFYQAFTRGGVWLCDEMDASDPTVLVTINQALANKTCTFPGAPDAVAMHRDFLAIGTGNTVGTGATAAYAGRQPLDQSTLDRFAFIPIGYDEQLERAISPHPEWTARVQALRAAAARVPGHALIITPRASIDGGAFVAAAMANGMARAEAFERAEEARVWKGCPRAVRDAITAEAAA